MSRWIVVPLLVLAACPSSDDRHDDPSTDTDTDVACRGCDTDPGLATDLPVETDEHEDTGDSSGNLVDTYKGCLLGEVADCNETCFPEWMLGDGTCDDGTTFLADFDCPLYGSDRGDCAGDTDEETGATGTCGSYRLEFHTTNWSNEVRWIIRRISDQAELYRSDFGAYTSDHSVYLHQGLQLPPDEYELIGWDAWGDGWQGAFWYLIDESTDMAVARGGPPDSPLGPPDHGSTRSWRFTTTCDTTTCEVDVLTLGGTKAQEMAWELYTNADKLVAQRSAGTVADDSVQVDTLRLYEGTYTLRLRDLAGDGWNGGRTEIRYDAGLLLRADGLYTGDNGSGSFTVDCSLAPNPAFDAPGDPLQFSTCDDVKLGVIELGDAPADVGWQLVRVSDWRQIVSRAPGSISFGSVTDTIDLQSGLYYLQLTDRGADGWQNARLRLDDPNGTTLLTAVLPGGATGGRYFRADCPPPVVDTDPPDTDPGEQGCLRFARPDCNDVCMPLAFIGDGFCDDGVQSSAHFACEATSFDDGDCAPPPPP